MKSEYDLSNMESRKNPYAAELKQPVKSPVPFEPVLTELDAEARFRLRAARGQGIQERGLELLRKAADDGQG